MTEPANLIGSANYASWKESVLSRARSVQAHFILNNKEIESPCKDEGKILWKEQNGWLYNLIWNSVSPQAKIHVNEPQDRIAYKLWQQLEARFQRPLEEERRELYYELISLRAKDCKDDREYIQKFQNLRMRLSKIGFALYDWQLIDLFYEGISKQFSDFLQFKIEQQRESNSQAVTLNIDTAIDEIITRLPKESNASGGNEKCFMTYEDRKRDQYQDQDRQRPQYPQRPLRQCSYCGSYRHYRESDCWFKYPEKAAPEWREEKHHLIEYYRDKNKQAADEAADEEAEQAADEEADQTAAIRWPACMAMNHD